MPGDLPQGILRRFYRVEGLAATRYHEALEEIGVAPPELPAFHVDAAGYSPEIALHVRDPFYLGRGPLAPRAIVVALEQLAAPLVHPSLGVAGQAFRRTTREARGAIATLLLHDALIVEVDHGSPPVAGPRELAGLARFQLRFRTPRGLVASQRRLEAMKREFLASDRLWLDDAFLHELAELARRVRDVGKLPPTLSESSHPLLPCYSAACGGAYVFEEGARNVVYLLWGEASPESEPRAAAGARELREHPLDAQTAVELLLEHRVLRFDPRGLRADPRPLEQALHWIAVHHLLEKDPERPLETLTPRRTAEDLADAADAPREYQELAEVLRRIAAGRDSPQLGTLEPLTRLRLLAPSSRRAGIRRFVSHLQAFLDPVDLERWWRDAPDVFFARLHALPSPHRHHLASRLDAKGAAGSWH
jgi:hypothetical protein